MKKINFFTGSMLVDEVESPINGKIQIIRSLAFGTFIQAGNLTQSGGVVYDVWRTTLKKLKNKKTKEPKNCLILGFGGGSAATLVKKYWPKVKITGVELDPIFIELGKKYLNLDDIGADIKLADAKKFVNKALDTKQSYDLILVDMYVGDLIPEFVEDEVFLMNIKKLLTKEGVVVFNRLYYGEKRKQAMKFGEQLEDIFAEVEQIFPEANVMFVCRS